MTVTGQTITAQDKIEVLEEIAISYLYELEIALHQASISRMSGVFGPTDTPTNLMAREQHLKSKVELLKRKLSSIGTTGVSL